MYTIVVRLGFDDFEAARERLSDVVPNVSDTPGFIIGYWTRSRDGGDGLAMLVFESEQTARAAKMTIDAISWPDMVALRGVALREVFTCAAPANLQAAA